MSDYQFILYTSTQIYSLPTISRWTQQALFYRGLIENWST